MLPAQCSGEIFTFFFFRLGAALCVRVRVHPRPGRCLRSGCHVQDGIGGSGYWGGKGPVIPGLTRVEHGGAGGSADIPLLLRGWMVISIRPVVVFRVAIAAVVSPVVCAVFVLRY